MHSTLNKPVQDKNIIYLLVLAITISLLSTAVSLYNLTGTQEAITGLPVGNVSVSINDVVEITLRTVNISFGTGSVNATVYSNETNCTLVTNTTKSAVSNNFTSTNLTDIEPGNSLACTGFTNGKTVASIEVENTGNHIVNVSMNSSRNASVLASATSSGQVQYIINEESSLAGGACLNSTITTFTDIPTNESTSNNNSIICWGLRHNDSIDSFLTVIRLVIPGDIAPGNKNFTITYTAIDLGIVPP